MSYITLTHVVLQEEGDTAYTGYCPELGTATCGDTPEEAWENLGEAVVMHLNALEETGERKKFFEERGIKIVSEPRRPGVLRGLRASPETRKWLDPSRATPLDISIKPMSKAVRTERKVLVTA
ncbi:MAG: hypothetical protein OXS35_07445 [Dehalococcoidia bacterium]|nr:hypothetical protein [Dehalococcoidia bacterium]